MLMLVGALLACKKAETVSVDQSEAPRLLHAVARWRTACEVRAYVRAIRSLVASSGLKIHGGGHGAQELAWAEAYAERIDPLTAWEQDIAQTTAEAKPGGA
jgi:hypothetical protein